jgi:hypothetical protein
MQENASCFAARTFLSNRLFFNKAIFQEQKPKGDYYDEKRRIYPDRTSGGHRYYRNFNGDINAGIESGQGAGQTGDLPEQSQAVNSGVDYVRR